MLWLKRNLVLAIGGLTALALLGGGAFYVYTGLARNEELKAEVEATRTKLNGIYGADVFPHATNIAAARAETTKLQAAVAKSHKFFLPVPVEKVDTRGFTRLRNNTLDELRTMAAQSQVKLPKDNYAFSFETQRSRNEFSADSFPAVPEQMMEIKALCTILFEARINQIGNIRRARVSVDDQRSSNAGDYLDRALDNVIVGPAQAASHHYEVTFFSFSTELATVLNGLERSAHGFITKAMLVEPEDMRMADVGGPLMGAVDPQPPVNTPRQNPRERFNPRANQPPPGRAPPPGPAVKPPAPDRPSYLLKERRLKVTMLVYTIKPAPAPSRQ